MARFSISMSVEVDADSYEQAMEIERSLHQFIEGHDEALGVYGIDVEQTSDLEVDEE
jgi:hypothetical protein